MDHGYCNQTAQATTFKLILKISGENRYLLYNMEERRGEKPTNFILDVRGTYIIWAQFVNSSGNPNLFTCTVYRILWDSPSLIVCL